MKTIRLAGFGDFVSMAQTAGVRDLIQSLPGSPLAELITLEPPRNLSRDVDNLLEQLFLDEADAGILPADQVPNKLPCGIAMGAVVHDRDARFWCASRGRPALSLLPSGSKLVTTHPVVRAQILHRYPWLWVELAPPGDEIGVGLRHGIWDAGCVAREILEFASASSLQSEPIPFEVVLPPAGQGALAILLRSMAELPPHWCEATTDTRMEVCLRTERRVVEAAADPMASVATAWAVLEAGTIDLTGLVAGRDGEWLVTDRARGPAAYADDLARDLADSCGQAGRSRETDQITIPTGVPSP